MLMVSYFTILLRVEVRRELEFAYAKYGTSPCFRNSGSVHPRRPPLVQPTGCVRVVISMRYSVRWGVMFKLWFKLRDLSCVAKFIK
jgi:hypothetical protein